jgi:hypothetical protein
MQVKDKPKAVAPTLGRPAVVLDQFYPSGSVLADIVDLARKNTDLPPLGALFGAYSRVSTALAQAGFTLRIESDAAVSPNLSLAVLVGDDADPGYLLWAIVQRVINTPQLCEVPGGMTSASLFAHALKSGLPIRVDSRRTGDSTDANEFSDTRCLSLLTLIEGEDWLKALHAESTLGKLRRHLLAGCHGHPLYQWTKKECDQYTAPVHLSLLVACRQSPYFAQLGGLFFSSAFIQQFLVVLADDRPAERKPLYENSGTAAAARAWTKAWGEILAGPRAYVPTPEAEAEYRAWWLGRLAVSYGTEHELRKVGRAGWKYALAIQALLDPNGFISVEAMRIALAIADRHLADHMLASNKLAWETTDERLARKVGEYIVANPKAPRGQVMNKVRGASDPAALNRALTRIAEMHAGTGLAERALELRAAARSIGSGDVHQPRS